MSYNMNELPRYIDTAGKITVITVLTGVMIFAVVFLLNLGVKEIAHVSAQSSGLATTSIFVLNTPPEWDIGGDAQELIESSTSSPTNSGSVLSWHATATDSNSEDYYLLICSGTSTPAEPTANPGAAPDCHPAQTQWAVSAAASSGAQAIAATTTTENAPFAEENEWYAWVCDAVTLNPRCNSGFRQGDSPTASPFNVNSRPTFTGIATSSGALPGSILAFNATADDADIDPIDDNVQLWVCSTSGFTATATDKCDAVSLASSTLALSNPTANYTIPTPFPDGGYDAFVFIVDNHNHTAVGGVHGSNANLTVLNATPTVPAGQIVLNDGDDMVLTQNASQTPGFELQFTVQDNNSCETDLGADEVDDFRISVYRSGIGTTTCDGVTGGQYNANNCYTTGVGTTTWNIQCTASSTSCTYGVDGLDDELVYDCTFPLWFVADPTDGGAATTTPFFAEDWRAAVTAIDDDNAMSSHEENTAALGTNEVRSFLYFSLDTLTIPYGQLEAGQFSNPTITASTTVRSEGNIGIDQELQGTPMCSPGIFSTAGTCPNSASSTIPAEEQAFATSSVTYPTATTSGNVLSSTTPVFLDLNVRKPTTTSETTTGVTFWGIRVPGTIQVSGTYVGENTFFGAPSDGSQW